MKKQKGRIIILSGPSGAGKTTLHDMLLEDQTFKNKVVVSISMTTRSPRGKEKHGRDYLFLSKKMFEYKIKAGHFLEWARVFDNYYGTSMKNVQDILNRGKHVLLCIDVQGASQVKKKLKNAITIFVKTPSMAELKRRLTARKTDSKQAIALRFKTAEKEIKEAKHYDHVIVNNKLPQAFKDLKKVLKKI